MNRCKVCGAEIPEEKQVCEQCVEMGVVDGEHPCEGCQYEEMSNCWKHCLKYIKWFGKVWQAVTKMLKRGEQ